MGAWLLWIIAALPPGRYVGVSTAGRVDLELREDGSASFGGVPCRWTATQRSLELVGAKDSWLFDVEAGVGGAILIGPPTGRLYLSPEPVSPPPPPPPPPARAVNRTWVGTWRHTASGGSVTLALAADGGYAFVQTLPGTVPRTTRGRWWGEPGALVLTADGDVVLRYTARRREATLEIGGGDLPFAVPFALLAEAPDPSVYSPRQVPQ